MIGVPEIAGITAIVLVYVVIGICCREQAKMARNIPHLPEDYRKS